MYHYHLFIGEKHSTAPAKLVYLHIYNKKYFCCLTRCNSREKWRFCTL